jgi:hypothetical protein
MTKSAVYSWRMSPATKAALEQEARRSGETLAALLDRVASEWLRARRLSEGETDAEQLRIRTRARRAIGRIAGGDPKRAERARVTLRERLGRRRAS